MQIREKRTVVDLNAALAHASASVETALQRLLPAPTGLHARAQEAMRYATFAGGKRMRPFLVLQSSRLFGVGESRAVRVAAAIEVLHTYSLVHDDLPSMDNDDLRRGRPTTHRAFDEATAILAGDGLLTLAFEILSDPATHPSADVRCALISNLAQAAGSNGMIGGQMIDMKASERALSADEVMLLQRLKTGALFEFSCEAGAILGEAPHADRERLRSFAQDFGLAFQITDDLLDVTSTAEKAGKSVGKDQDQGKATLISIYGLEGAKAEAEKLVRRACATLDVYGENAAELQALADYLLGRES
ncbi:MAG TPA: farnesyl diphosphate synthase [Rhizomicrobium sp.]|nr:farnesyl diphosphate synthase [Rhizomicrobium sp.]